MVPQPVKPNRPWNNWVRELVRSSSGKPNEGCQWILEVWDPLISRTALEAKLHNPCAGNFATLDAILTIALIKSACRDLGLRILNRKEEQTQYALPRTMLILILILIEQKKASHRKPTRSLRKQSAFRI